MKIIKITKSDLDENNYYKQDGIGAYDKYEDVSIEIEENLGTVSVKKGFYVNGSITAKAGSGIQAGSGIKAGDGIQAGWGIQAGSGIKAGDGIQAGWGIKAGWGIQAGDGIQAGWGIQAGSGIKAGDGIQAGSGIVSLYSGIKAKLKIQIDARCKIAAGIFSYNGAREVEAQEIEGEVIYGIKKLLPKLAEDTGEIIELNGIKYKRI